MAIHGTRRIIDDAGAEAVLGAAERHARRHGHRVVMAVVDPWGEVVLLRRTPGAQAASSRVAVDPKSGYADADIGRYHQPGSNGLAFSPDGLLTICQHGNRRVIRVNPHGDTTVLADAFGGRRLNSPNDLVYRSDGTLYFTDPPFGLPAGFDDH
jgi:sugar lactone lactonase YvrE